MKRPLTCVALLSLFVLSASPDLLAATSRTLGESQDEAETARRTPTKALSDPQLEQRFLQEYPVAAKKLERLYQS